MATSSSTAIRTTTTTRTAARATGRTATASAFTIRRRGPSTIIRGCRAWINSDDGYDLISQEVPVIVENSWAIQNGFANGGSVSPSVGNGNGFKMGSSQTGIRHIVQNNVAWKNKAAGFYANHSSGGNTWYNNTSYMNGTQYNMLASPPGDATATITLTGALAHKMRNNIGFPNRNTNMGGVDTMFNTWDLNIAQTAADFASTTDTGATGPRQADGSMPAVNFLKLVAGSPLIDKGTNVGLPFVGAAPDLGAYEFGAVTTTGTGGSGAGGAGATGAGGSNRGTGGSAGAGGASGVGGMTTTGGAGGSTVAGTGGTRAGTAGAPGGGSGGASEGSGGTTGGNPATGGCTCALAAGGAAGDGAGLAGLLAFALVAAGITGARRRRRTPTS